MVNSKSKRRNGLHHALTQSLENFQWSRVISLLIFFHMISQILQFIQLYSKFIIMRQVSTLCLLYWVSLSIFIKILLLEHFQTDHNIVISSDEILTRNMAIEEPLVNLTPCMNQPALFTLLEKQTAKMFILLYPALTSKNRMNQVFLTFRYDLLTLTFMTFIKMLIIDIECCLFLYCDHKFYRVCWKRC